MRIGWLTLLLLVPVPAFGQAVDVPALAQQLRDQGAVGVASPNIAVAPDVQRQVRALLSALHERTRARAYLVTLARDTPVEALADALYVQANLAGDDVLIVSNAGQWQIETDALPRRTLRDLGQRAADPALQLGVMARLRVVADALPQLMAQSPRPQADSKSMLWLGVGLGALATLLAGLFGYAIGRKGRRQT